MQLKCVGAPLSKSFDSNLGCYNIYMYSIILLKHQLNIYSCLMCMNNYIIILIPSLYAAGEDYLIGVAPYTATFAPGETTATVLIPIRNDSCPEPRESFNALLSIPGPAASLGVRASNRNRSTVWIDDDDCLEVVFDPTSYSVNENDGVACLTLKANGTASCNYSVQIDTLDGTATGKSMTSNKEYVHTLHVELSSHNTGGEDYTSGPYELTFIAGSAEAELKVDITDDDIAEGAEEFTAKLQIPPNTSPKCIVVGSQDTATISIIDDEGKCYTITAYTFKKFL